MHHDSPSDIESGAPNGAPEVEIVVRDPPTGPTAETPRHWFAERAFETHFFNALSSTFPEGERFFIASVRHFAPGVDDAAKYEPAAAGLGRSPALKAIARKTASVVIDTGPA